MVFCVIFEFWIFNVFEFVFLFRFWLLDWFFYSIFYNLQRQQQKASVSAGERLDSRRISAYYSVYYCAWEPQWTKVRKHCTQLLELAIYFYKNDFQLNIINNRTALICNMFIIIYSFILVVMNIIYFDLLCSYFHSTQQATYVA